jgi:hypothetical protein
VPLVIVVNPSFPARTVPEFIAYAKANPGKINMASASSGGSPHVTGELFKMMTGITMQHVPIAALRLLSASSERTGAGAVRILLFRFRISLALDAGYKIRRRDQSPAASAPRVRGSAAPTIPCGVTAIEFADVRRSSCTTLWPRASSSWITSAGRPRSSDTSSGSHW